ncbi:MAG: sigma factor-like helix-turn-helix DNA-binding protein [Synergistaceae bacterium]|nr:sigma factor-like helix-turn-helix DNA-binding protein [Synergistaceae bacterium]
MAREEKYFERRVLDGMLFDAWQASLTEKQKVACGLVFEQDMSLSEASAELGVSRQAVHDLINAARKKMQRFEEYADRVGIDRKLKQIERLIEKFKFSLPPDFYAQIKELLKEDKQQSV